MQTRSIWKASDRDNRREFALVQLACLALAGCLSAWAFFLPQVPKEEQWPPAVALLAATIMVVWLQLASGGRRAHDLNKSSWYALLMLAPILNLVVLAVFLFARGNAHANRFGPAPDADALAAKDRAWAAAYQELNSQERNDASWAHALAAAKGEQGKAEAAYLDQRSRQLFAMRVPDNDSAGRRTSGWGEFSGAVVLLLAFAIGTAMTVSNEERSSATSAAAAMDPLCAQQLSDPSAMHFCTIFSSHPDFKAIAQSDRFKDYVSKTPGAARIVASGSASEIVGLFDAYKRASFMEDLTGGREGKNQQHAN